MKIKKALYLVPFAVLPIIGCNKSAEVVEVSLDEATKLADNYQTSISNKKASNIIVGGHINKFNISGDMTWWSYEREVSEGGDSEEASSLGSKLSKSSGLNFESLCSYIPNFSFKNGELSIDEQDIGKFTIPGSLLNIYDLTRSISTSTTDDKIFTTLFNLPKFPMSPRLLKILGGVEEIVYKKDSEGYKTNEIDWDNCKAKTWDYCTVKYTNDNGKLGFECFGEDLEKFVEGIDKRLDKSDPETNNSSNEEKLDPVPFTLSIKTNETGFIDSIGINVKGNNINVTEEEGELYYFSLQGNAEIDLKLNFTQEKASPLTIKYQVVEYEILKAEEEYQADAVYGDTYLKKSKTSDLATDLSTFKDYFTVDWYRNVSQSKYGDLKLNTKYDDPLFNYNYWGDRAKNIAFDDEIYDVLIVPKYEVTTDPDSGVKTIEPKYRILGFDDESYSNKLVESKSLFSASHNGKVISIDYGFSIAGEKLLLSSADKVKKINIEDNGANAELMCDEIFINSNMLTSSEDNEYIISIPVCKYFEAN